MIKNNFIYTCVFVWFLFPVAEVMSQANLQVFPTRLALSDSQRVGTFSVRHLGDKPQKYKAKVVFYRMFEDGSMSEQVEKPNESEKSLIDHVKITPRSVKLIPNVEQVMRILVVPKKELPEGDYRAHIYFEPDDEVIDEADVKNQSNKSVTMNIRAKIAVAVPVVYRRGQASATFGIDDLKLVSSPKGGPKFSLYITRKGNAFGYGSLVLSLIPKKGKAVEIGRVSGLAVYVDRRQAQFPVQIPSGLSLIGAKLKADFIDDEIPKDILLSTKEVNL